MIIEKIESQLRIVAETKLEAMELGIICTKFDMEKIHFERTLCNPTDEAWIKIDLRRLVEDEK